MSRLRISNDPEEAEPIDNQPTESRFHTIAVFLLKPHLRQPRINLVLFYNLWLCTLVRVIESLEGGHLGWRGPLISTWITFVTRATKR
jgi:hypothetical protein